MYNIAIIEDDDGSAAALQENIARFIEEKNCPLSVTRFRSIEDFMLPRQACYEIVFFDIELPGMNGIEGAKRFRSTDADAVIIFITNLAKYAINGYEVEAMDYMLKPVSYNNLALKLSKAVDKVQSKKWKTIAVRDRDEVYRFSVSDIYYLEVRDHDITFHTGLDLNGGIVRVTGTLSTFEEELKDQFFSRCNSCYLVNLRAVSTIQGTTVYLRNGARLNISRRKKKDFFNDFMQYIGKN